MGKYNEPPAGSVPRFPASVAASMRGEPEETAMTNLDLLPAQDNGPAAAGVAISARLRDEIQRRVRELEARCPAAMTPSDRRELAGLRELLTLPTKGTFDD
jgi:hypothetical protein